MPEITGRKQGANHFRPGRSGNPSGRPRGTRHRVLLALDAIGAEGAEDIVRSVVAAARSGDLKAADILLRRLWPERRSRPVLLDLPVIKTADDIVAALGKIVCAVAAGELTPDEAAGVTSIIEAQRRAIETLELEKRITSLEEVGVERQR